MLLRLVVATVVVLRRRPTTARRFGQVDADGLDAARILEYETDAREILYTQFRFTNFMIMVCMDKYIQLNTFCTD